MDDPQVPDDRLAELRASARGWHGIQLAALGFIGLCGVIQTGDAGDPEMLQWLAGALVLVAFALACAGIYLVGRAAWPLYGAGPEPAGDADPRAVAIASVQLKRGLLMTFLSIAAITFATATAWWPQEEPGSASGAGAEVQVQASDGQAWCGRLAQASQPGALRVDTASEPVVVALDTLASVRPVDGC